MSSAAILADDENKMKISTITFRFRVESCFDDECLAGFVLEAPARAARLHLEEPPCCHISSTFPTAIEIIPRPSSHARIKLRVFCKSKRIVGVGARSQREIDDTQAALATLFGDTVKVWSGDIVLINANASLSPTGLDLAAAELELRASGASVDRGEERHKLVAKVSGGTIQLFATGKACVHARGWDELTLLTKLARRACR